MSRQSFRSILSLVVMVGVIGFVNLDRANATTIELSPGDETWISNDNSNCDAACVEGITGLTGLSLAYKSDVGGGDSGTFAGSYTTTFSNSPGDPADALIQWNGIPSTFINCGECILNVKDGNQDPAQYFFNLGSSGTTPFYSWDGQMDLDLTAFWPSNGAISHVAIFAGDTGPGPGPGPGPGGLPVPSTFLLIGVGLVGLGLAHLKKGPKN